MRSTRKSTLDHTMVHNVWLHLFFRKLLPTMEYLMENSETSDISPVDQTGSRAFSVARDKLKLRRDSDIRDRHKDVRKHFLRILKQSQTAREEKVEKIRKKWHWGLRDKAILEIRSDCKRKTRNFIAIEQLEERRSTTEQQQLTQKEEREETFQLDMSCSLCYVTDGIWRLTLTQCLCRWIYVIYLL